MNGEKVELKEQLNSLSKQLEKANQTSDELRSAGERSSKELLEWKVKSETLDSKLQEMNTNYATLVLDLILFFNNLDVKTNYFLS